MSGILEKESTLPQQKISEIRNLIVTENEKRESILKNISVVSQSFLLDKKSILLYGFSTMVIAALEDIPDDVKKDTTVYIAECRGKTQFNSSNIMTHNDGVSYLKKVIEIGYKNIKFITDISVGNYMKRNKISKVLFGANGIDKNTGSFGHTCGHSTIADLASLYNVPVYVIADTGKLGDLKWQENLERKINWLPNNEEISWETDEFDEIIVKIELGNPREDLVDPDKVYMIVTEKGIFPPSRISIDLVKNEN
jgi:translation initiation factor 2B subunit (eIF-2B alpha/beta/delta family)